MSEGLGAMMAGGNPHSSRGRQEGDFYSTPVEVTDAFMRFYKPMLYDVWEPCAGDGKMGDVITGHGRHTLMTDLNPRRDDIIAQDFLAARHIPDGFDTIVTNPPFDIAEKLIWHAFAIGCQRLALVLKSSFWHAKGRQRLFQAHRPSHILPLTWRPDFLELGRPTMEVAWVVWDTPDADFTIYHPLNKV